MSFFSKLDSERHAFTTAVPAVGGNIKKPTGHVMVTKATGSFFRNEGVGSSCLYTDMNRLINRYDLVERFELRPGINADRDVPAANTYNTAQMQLGIDKSPHFEVLGTNATSALVTFSDGGGITLTTGASANDQIIIAPHLNSAVSAWTAAKWNTSDEVIFEAVVKLGATITTYKFWAGFKLTNTNAVATDNDQAYFLIDTANSNSTKFIAVTSRSGTDTETDTGLAFAASTAYHLKIVADSDRKARFYINDVLYVEAAALTADVDLIPYVGVMTTTTAARAATLRGLRCSKTLND